jgi:hypothetical protein
MWTLGEYEIILLFRNRDKEQFNEFVELLIRQGV